MRSKKALQVFLVFALLLLIAGCATDSEVQTQKPLADETLYLSNNIHGVLGREAKASYANWTDPGVGHFILAVNTPIAFEPWRGGFAIIDKQGNKTVYFEYNPRNMGMTAEEYERLISSPAPVDLSQLSEKDREGIAEGKALVGMSKDGVRIALGYPASHRTPSLRSATWVYWQDRFRTLRVEFDDAGLVKRIVQ